MCSFRVQAKPQKVETTHWGVPIRMGCWRNWSKRKRKQGLSNDSWWVFHYACGQVGLPPPCRPHSSPAFDSGLWPTAPQLWDGRPMAIQSTAVHAVDSGVSRKGEVASGELRLFLLWCFFFCECVKWSSGSSTKAFLLDWWSFNIKQQVAFFAAKRGCISWNHSSHAGRWAVTQTQKIRVTMKYFSTSLINYLKRYSYNLVLHGQNKSSRGFNSIILSVLGQVLSFTSKTSHLQLQI